MENGYNFISSVTTLVGNTLHTHTQVKNMCMKNSSIQGKRKAFSITCAKSWKTIIYAALIFNEDIDLYIR